jgi:hypothetical protein
MTVPDSSGRGAAVSDPARTVRGRPTPERRAPRGVRTHRSPVPTVQPARGADTTEPLASGGTPSAGADGAYHRAARNAPLQERTRRTSDGPNRSSGRADE